MGCRSELTRSDIANAPSTHTAAATEETKEDSTPAVAAELKEEAVADKSEVKADETSAAEAKPEETQAEELKKEEAVEEKKAE